MSNNYKTNQEIVKTVFGQSVEKLVPDNCILQKLYPVSEMEKIGDFFEVPVVLEGEQGFTYAAEGADVPTLSGAVAGAIKKAKVGSNPKYLQSVVSYEMVSRARAKGPQAYDSSLVQLMSSMLDSGRKRQEISFIYGKKPLTRAASISGSSTTRAIVCTAASWAEGMWFGAKGAKLDAYNGSSLLNTNADIIIVSVDTDTRTINVSGNATDLTALESPIASVDLYYKDAYTNDNTGLDAFATASTTINNLDPSVYSLWKGNSYAVGGAITRLHVLKALTKGGNKGASGEHLCLLNPTIWNTLADNESSLRVQDNSKEAVMGYETLKLLSPVGPCKIIPHPMVKFADGFIFPKNKMQVVGAQDIVFGLPGKDDIFIDLEGKAGCELRAIADFTWFAKAPGHLTKMTGITG